MAARIAAAIYPPGKDGRSARDCKMNSGERYAIRLRRIAEQLSSHGQMVDTSESVKELYEIAEELELQSEKPRRSYIQRHGTD